MESFKKLKHYDISFKIINLFVHIYVYIFEGTRGYPGDDLGKKKVFKIPQATPGT